MCNDDDGAIMNKHVSAHTIGPCQTWLPIGPFTS